jgi:cob(I)alamin adenosyltransferase
MKIYTKTGDSGESGLYSGERLSKDSKVFDVLGNLDELNASLGIVASSIQIIISMDKATSYEESAYEDLERIQSTLIDIGASVATATSIKTKTAFDVNGSNLKWLEDSIDTVDAKTPTLKNFILPGGGDYTPSSHLHLARAVARRLERSVVAIKDDVEPSVLKYLNRLSDYLFVLARFLSYEGGDLDRIKRTSAPTTVSYSIRSKVGN